MNPYRFTCWIPGEAKSERKRQRPFKLGNGTVRMGPRTDEPDRAEWKSWVRLCVAQAIGQPTAGPLRLTVYVMGPPPKSTPKNPTAKFPWPWARMRKPDASNYGKLLEDAINGIGYADDGQIIHGQQVKLYGPVTGVLMVLEEVTEEENAAAVAFVLEQVERQQREA